MPLLLILLHRLYWFCRFYYTRFTAFATPVLLILLHHFDWFNCTGFTDFTTPALLIYCTGFTVFTAPTLLILLHRVHCFSRQQKNRTIQKIQCLFDTCSLNYKKLNLVRWVSYLHYTTFLLPEYIKRVVSGCLCKKLSSADASFNAQDRGVCRIYAYRHAWLMKTCVSWLKT